MSKPLLRGKGCRKLGEIHSQSLAFLLKMGGTEEMITCVKGKKGHMNAS